MTVSVFSHGCGMRKSGWEDCLVIMVMIYGKGFLFHARLRLDPFHTVVRSPCKPSEFPILWLDIIEVTH